MAEQTDVVVIGGGIVGLATAYQLTQKFPEKRVVVLEKEADLGQHQTGRNSGVIHSGVYYTPGSLKAENCRKGKKALEAFCDEEGINYEICGKVIVATKPKEVPVLNEILENGRANGVQCEMIGRERLAELEPHAAGVAAIHVPETGIVDYGEVCERLAACVRACGGEIRTEARVDALHRYNGSVVLESTAGDVEASYVINCAGLQSDRVASLSGDVPEVKIVPFRGEYYELAPEARRLCRTLIYPVPDPGFPFLGVHFTKMIDGRVECGPNAVLAFAREGYNNTTVDWSDLVETLTYPGFLKLAATYWSTGLKEMWRSFSKKAFVRALQVLVPDIRADDLTAAPAGVRAQAITPDGKLLDDFLFLEADRVINVCNAPSPAATASLNIGATIVDKLAAQFD